MHARSLTALLGIALFSACNALAQNPAPTVSTPDTSMPKDPKALLSLAREVNGLSSPDMKPWHIKYSYQTFDSAGSQVNQGTVEEWWAAPDKYKRVWTSTHFNQTEYRTKDGYFHTGDNGSPSVAELILVNRVLSPISAEDKPEERKIQLRDNPFPHTPLNCVESAGYLQHVVAGEPAGVFPLYCFDQDKPILRVAGSYGTYTSFYSQIGVLDGHYLPVSIEIKDSEKLFVRGHLEQGNLLPAVNDAVFQTPTDAITESPIKTIAASNAVMNGYRVGGAQPIYPQADKQERIEGKVVLSVLVAEDGSIESTEVISAPDYRLAVAAMLAVRSWKYHPYLLNGKPVSVETQINVIYRLGG